MEMQPLMLKKPDRLLSDMKAIQQQMIGGHQYDIINTD